MLIVCVDDHPIMLQGLQKDIQQILPRARIHAFERPQEALLFVQEQGCDVLICEIELSGADGIGFAQKVKSFKPDVNIIFHTVCDEKEHAREVIKLKPSGYLTKPAQKEQLEFELSNLRYPVGGC